MATIRTPYELGVAVRNARRLAGLTQADLADKAAVSRAWVIRLERGEGGLEIERAFKVLRALDLAVATTKTEQQSASSAIDGLFRRLSETP